jgi:hypothetical protein
MMNKQYDLLLPKIKDLQLWETAQLVENYLSVRRIPGGLIYLNIIPASDSRQVWIDKANTVFAPFTEFNLSDSEYTELTEWFNLSFAERMELYLDRFNTAIDRITDSACHQLDKILEPTFSFERDWGVPQNEIYILDCQHEVDIFNRYKPKGFRSDPKPSQLGDSILKTDWDDAYHSWTVFDLGVHN